MDSIGISHEIRRASTEKYRLEIPTPATFIGHISRSKIKIWTKSILTLAPLTETIFGPNILLHLASSPYRLGFQTFSFM